MIKRWLTANIIAVLPVFIAVNIASLLVWLLAISQQSMPLVLGIIAGGLVDLDHRFTGRIKNLFYTLIAFTISSIATQLTLGHSHAFIMVMTTMTFIFTMLGALGQRYNTVAFGTLVVALYTGLTYLPATPWYLNPLMILTGTLLYSITAMLVYLLFPHRPVQENICKSFLALADYLETKASFFDPDDIDELEQKQVQLALKNNQVIQSFNECRTSLFYRLKGQHRHSRTQKMLRYYVIAQEIHEKVNSSHFNYQRMTQQLKNSDLLFRIQRLLELQAQTCRQFAYQLQQNMPYQHNLRLEKALQGIQQSFEYYQQQHSQSQQFPLQTLIENLQNVAWQLQHLDQDNQQEKRQHQQINNDNITGLSNILETVRSQLNFRSPLFRHALRLSIVVFICCSIAEFLQLERGYWILLTAIFVCQPNYSATKTRLKQRIVGTILGVIVGSLLPYIGTTLETKLGIVVLSSTLFFFFRSNNYSFSTFFITIQVLMSFDIIGFDLHGAMIPRVIDTLTGSIISWLAVSYLWPDWKYLELNKVSTQALKANAKYLLYIVSQLQFGQVDDLKYRIARRNAHNSANTLYITVANMNNEPHKYQSHLSEGFQLLKLNASLLSYISALGAYRSHMANLKQQRDFLAQFYPTAKKMIYTLEHLNSLNTKEFDQLQQQISENLKQFLNDYNQQLSQIDFTVPIQQLEMMNQLLPNLYHAIQTMHK
ncbi:hypothetical protein A6A20_02850 [Volucribacter amazonae]|uniref:Membrane protein (TIGR01666 family) n=1 Tax=Volucribacter amazonae TaxID=256731 RepID=A0A9X4PBM8_9PAST|nr:hypothetical protein [Volucribacter amazonae]